MIERTRSLARLISILCCSARHSSIAEAEAIKQRAARTNDTSAAFQVNNLMTSSETTRGPRVVCFISARSLAIGE